MSPAKMNQQQGTSGFSDWVAEIQRQIATDPRAQPWKQTFGDNANRGFGAEDTAELGGAGSVQHNAGSALSQTEYRMDSLEPDAGDKKEQ